MNNLKTSHEAPIWLKYFDGKATIREVINEYEIRGYDSCQDIPSNYHWEELYNELGPDTKVILTVRDSTDRWWNSFVNFFTQDRVRRTPVSEVVRVHVTFFFFQKIHVRVRVTIFI